MRRRPHASAALLWIAIAAWFATAAPTAQELALPNTPGSVKFAAIGDYGNGSKAQYEVAAMMAKLHESFPYEFVITMGDNLYGSQTPRDFELKFEIPYKPLLDRGVKFYASLGNHDNQENRFYKPWNMNGERYYSHKHGDVRFFVLDSDYLDTKQRDWLERELKGSTDRWKIVYFHHPLYSSGMRHGSEIDLRMILEPLFMKFGVNAVFQGHDHIYERLKPQRGIYYFVEGASGQLRRGNLRRSDLTAAGYDQDQSFMLVEIDGDTLHFQAVSRVGKVVDSGALPRQQRANQTASAAGAISR
jgi:hypothetical protein